jgi:hypothetical protein
MRSESRVTGVSVGPRASAWLLLTVWLVLTPRVLAQPTSTIQVHVHHDSVPVAGADVVVNDRTYATSATGDVTIPAAAGSVIITVVKDGFEPLTSPWTSLPVRPCPCCSICGLASGSKRT